MPSIYYNPHLPAERGRVILRRFGNRQVYVAAPIRRETSPSPAVLAQRVVFAESGRYASGVFRHPQRQLAYVDLAKAKGVPLFNAIMTDFLKSPVIQLLDTSGYHGRVGDAIVLRTRNDLPPLTVTVTVRSANGVALESGEALGGAGAWQYIATQAAPAGTPLTLEVTVADADSIEVKRTVPLVVAA